MKCHLLFCLLYVICRSADRILYYNYTIDYVERNVTQEVTTRVYRCPPGAQESLRWYIKSSVLSSVCSIVLGLDLSNKT